MDIGRRRGYNRFSGRVTREGILHFGRNTKVWKNGILLAALAASIVPRGSISISSSRVPSSPISLAPGTGRTAAASAAADCSFFSSASFLALRSPGVALRGLGLNLRACFWFLRPIFIVS